MKKQRKTILVLAFMVVFVALSVLPGLVCAGDLEPPAAPDDDASAMYTIEDLYNYIDTGVAGAKRTGGFAEPVSGPGSTGRTLDEVHAKITEKCITCEGTLNVIRWCDQGDGTVKDMTTGLVWLKKADWGGTKPWRNFSTDCSSPNYTCYDDAHTRAGLLKDGSAGADLSDGSSVGDWRLPTKEELYGLTHGAEPVRSGTPRAFTGVQSNYYWSSTTYDASNTNAALWVSLLDGSLSPYGKNVDFYVWPVRSDN